MLKEWTEGYKSCGENASLVSEFSSKDNKSTIHGRFTKIHAFLLSSCVFLQLLIVRYPYPLFVPFLKTVFHKLTSNLSHICANKMFSPKCKNDDDEYTKQNTDKRRTSQVNLKEG